MARQLCLIALCVLLVVASALAIRERPIGFANLSRAQTAIAAAGYHCTSDRADGRVEFGFMVTRETTDWTAVGAVLKIGSSESDWRGRVWVTKVGQTMQLQSVPDAAEVRTWGNLVVFGDRRLLDEIESTLRRIS